MHFGDLYKYFPDAIVLGLSDKDTGRSVLNPDPATIIGPDDNLVLMRPSSIPSAVYQPLKKALRTNLGGRHSMPALGACGLAVMHCHLRVPTNASMPSSLDNVGPIYKLYEHCAAHWLRSVQQPVQQAGARVWQGQLAQGPRSCMEIMFAV